MSKAKTSDTRELGIIRNKLRLMCSEIKEKIDDIDLEDMDAIRELWHTVYLFGIALETQGVEVEKAKED